MSILQIAAIGIITAISAMILKEHKQETALLVGITGGILILLSVIEYFSNIFTTLLGFMDASGIPSGVYAAVFRIVGIGYITDFAAGIVEDTGSKAVASKIVLAGKLIIMVLSLPILQLLFDTIVSMLG